VFIIAYLVGMGIDYSSRQEFKEILPTIGRGEELADDIGKFDELRDGDLIANAAAVEEFGDRLRAKLGAVEDSDERESYAEKIDSIENELLN
jgi:hypothetical protein